MKPNILYIEDQPDSMALIRRILNSERYNLIEACTGLQGIYIAEHQDVDVILLDINLADIDGFAVAQHLRHSTKEELTKIPIIAVTANAMKGDAAKILGAGFDYYISKPINIQELMNKVETYTKNKVNLRN